LARLPATGAGLAQSPGLTISYHDAYRFHLGGVDVQIFHFGPGETDEDAVVYFPDKKVVAIGDLYSDHPSPDYASGGSLVGWDSEIGQILKLDFDVAVPSSGPAVTRGEIEQFSAALDRHIALARDLVSKGISKKDLAARLNTGELGAQLNFTPGQIDHLYAELAR
jgi:glyoxylase-like metal-dependent hydrolase (beta-lactamase superfamily II)